MTRRWRVLRPLCGGAINSRFYHTEATVIEGGSRAPQKNYAQSASFLSSLSASSPDCSALWVDGNVEKVELSTTMHNVLAGGAVSVEVKRRLLLYGN